MCNFFSFCTMPDSSSDFYYFDWQMRQTDKAGADSHSHICGEDFAKYIVSRNCNVSDVSMTQDVTTPEPPEDALHDRIAELEAENAALKAKLNAGETVDEWGKPDWVGKDVRK